MSRTSANKPAMPEAEIAIGSDLVRDLISTQAPQWASEEITYLATGWDNEVFRLGSELIIRLPRRVLGETIGAKERKWLPELASASGLEIGVPLFEGKPTSDYPFTFSICPFAYGSSAAEMKRRQRDAYAKEFSGLLKMLHQPAQPDAPASEFRGCPLDTVDARTRLQITQLATELQAPASKLWDEALAAEVYAGQPVWLHGDPHPHNTIVDDSGSQDSTVTLVDFGDLCIGDPASDLGMFWMHFSPAGISEAFDQYGAEPYSPIWRRSRGWGLRYAMLTAGLGPSDLLGIVGRETLGILLADSDSPAIAG
ncbi:aminoglycoside phosphotransferase family protein [Glutamicibacter arilaitensis]|uniref:aminoglycoside phosphotransferase family protein n=1 Tax=Glutamicibacter TaxID=1742989 RepID=UPI000EC8DB88|nr:aminoglycoside phosphotransferase family protein [Glutamicibacter sp.]HCJ55685.1 hypothetical protein [Glutamicibacter sp.]